MSMLINYKNVSVFQEVQEVLSDVTFSINEGEFVYIIGKVGTGKSSLLKTLYGELSVSDGEAEVMGYNMVGLKNKYLPELRRKLGIIFQDFQLLTDRTVEKNLQFVLKATGWKDRNEIDERIKEVLSLVGMETKGYKLPSELSGGEQQRIAIARAILNRPKLILADEPTGNLDVDTCRKITELLQRLVTEYGSTVVMITHNMNLLDKYPGRVFECKDHHLRELTDYNNIAEEEEEIKSEDKDEELIIEEFNEVEDTKAKDGSGNDSSIIVLEDIDSEGKSNKPEKSGKEQENNENTEEE
mgnify:CR=1 FL=1